jgi:hypothetical protein
MMFVTVRRVHVPVKMAASLVYSKLIKLQLDPTSWKHAHIHIVLRKSKEILAKSYIYGGDLAPAAIGRIHDVFLTPPECRRRALRKNEISIRFA